MGSTDRFIRIFIAVALLTTFYTDTVTGTLGYVMAAVAGVLILTTFGTLAYVLMALALIFLLTSFLSFCPLYLPFGISTCNKEKS